MGTKTPEQETIKSEKRKISTTYTIGRFKDVVKALNEAKLINELEKQQLVELVNTLQDRWIGGEFKL